MFVTGAYQTGVPFNYPVETSTQGPCVYLPSSAVSLTQNGGHSDLVMETKGEGPINVFVAGLLQEIDDAQLRALFTPFGTVLSSKVMLDVRTGISRGFGFVLFARTAEAAAAVAGLDGTQLGRNTLHLSLSEHDGSITAVPRIYVRNLPRPMPAENILSFFRQFGEVVSYHLRDDLNPNTAAPAQLLTLEYSTVEAAAAAVRGANGLWPFPNSVLPLLVKFSESPACRERRQQLKMANCGNRHLKVVPTQHVQIGRAHV